jgi:hypothetical protein
MLDSNEYIFGLSGTKASCVQLIDQLDTLHVFVPLIVVREVERNLERQSLLPFGHNYPYKFCLSLFSDNIYTSCRCHTSRGRYV